MKVHPRDHAKVSMQRATEIVRELPQGNVERNLLAALISANQLSGNDFLVITSPRSKSYGTFMSLFQVLLKLGGLIC